MPDYIFFKNKFHENQHKDGLFWNAMILVCLSLFSFTVVMLSAKLLLTTNTEKHEQFRNPMFEQMQKLQTLYRNSRISALPDKSISWTWHFQPTRFCPPTGPALQVSVLALIRTPSHALNNKVFYMPVCCAYIHIHTLLIK